MFSKLSLHKQDKWRLRKFTKLLLTPQLTAAGQGKSPGLWPLSDQSGRWFATILNWGDFVPSALRIFVNAWGILGCHN
jgi:hypothetical protein